MKLQFGAPEFCSQDCLDSGWAGGINLAGPGVDGAIGTVGE